MTKENIFKELLKESKPFDIGDYLFADLDAYKKQSRSLYHTDNTEFVKYMSDQTPGEEKDTSWEKQALSTIFKYVETNQVQDSEFKQMLQKLKPLKAKYPHILEPSKDQDFFYRGRSGFSLSTLLTEGSSFIIKEMLQTYLIIKIPLTIKVRRGFNSFTTAWTVATTFEGGEAHVLGGHGLSVLPGMVIREVVNLVKKEYPYNTIEEVLTKVLLDFEEEYPGIAVVKSSDDNFILNPNFTDSVGEGLNESEVLYIGSSYTTTYVGLNAQGMKPLVPKAIALSIFESISTKESVEDLESKVEKAFQSLSKHSNPKISNFIKLLTQEF